MLVRGTKLSDRIVIGKSDLRYGGEPDCRMLYTSMASLNVTRAFTGSQFSLARTGAMCLTFCLTRSYLLVPIRTQDKVFWTHCNLCKSDRQPTKYSQVLEKRILILSDNDLLLKRMFTGLWYLLCRLECSYECRMSGCLSSSCFV